MVSAALIVPRRHVAFGGLRSDDAFHLGRAEASPVDLRGAKTAHGPREPRVSGNQSRRLRGIDCLGIVNRRQRRPHRGDGHGVPGLHRVGKQRTQAIPHVPSGVIHPVVLPICTARAVPVSPMREPTTELWFSGGDSWGVPGSYWWCVHSRGSPFIVGGGVVGVCGGGGGGAVGGGRSSSSFAILGRRARPCGRAGGG